MGLSRAALGIDQVILRGSIVDESFKEAVIALGRSLNKRCSRVGIDYFQTIATTAGNERDCWTAVRAIGQIGGMQAIEVLTELLRAETKGQMIRRATAQVLVQIGGVEEKKIAVDILKSLAKKGTNAWIRQTAAKGLGQIGGVEEKRIAVDVLAEGSTPL
jgi:HEAT repeat protein